MIDLLNRHFIPVFTSNEDYRDGGAAPAEERAALQRIFREGHEKKLSVGSVHAYVTGPDGHLLSSLHTAEAAKPAKLILLLENAVSQLKTPDGAPVIRPTPPKPPDCGPGSIRLHITARYLERKGDDYILTEDPGGGWAAVPGTDWVCLDKGAFRSMLPEENAMPGRSWSLPRELTESILKYFYPPTENNDVSKNRFESAELKATLVSRNRSRAVVRIEGQLRMRHDFYHKEDGRYVVATLLGYAEVDTRNSALDTFNLVTEKAEYFDAEGKNALPFGVAVKLVP